MNRRDWIKGLSLGATAGALGVLSRAEASAAEATARAAKGSAPLKITKTRAFATRPARVNLIVVTAENNDSLRARIGKDNRWLVLFDETGVQTKRDPRCRSNSPNDQEWPLAEAGHSFVRCGSQE